MRPALSPGDQVFVDPSAFATRCPCVGELVVARHPIQGDVILVKRVLESHGDGSVILESINEGAGCDSRHFGRVARDLLLGPVSLHLRTGGAAQAAP